MPERSIPTPRFPYKSDRLKPLRAFCQTVRLGSVSRASEALYVSQPAITLQLQALERELGVPLFERSGPLTRTDSSVPAGVVSRQRSSPCTLL